MNNEFLNTLDYDADIGNRCAVTKEEYELFVLNSYLNDTNFFKDEKFKPHIENFYLLLRKILGLEDSKYNQIIEILKNKPNKRIIVGKETQYIDENIVPYVESSICDEIKTDNYKIFYLIIYYLILLNQLEEIKFFRLYDFKRFLNNDNILKLDLEFNFYKIIKTEIKNKIKKLLLEENNFYSITTLSSFVTMFNYSFLTKICESFPILPESDQFFNLIFNPNKLVLEQPATEPDILEQPPINPNTLNILKIIKIIADELVIFIDDVKFILIAKFVKDERCFYLVKSQSKESSQINTFLYYASNSEMGLLRWASFEVTEEGKKIYAKYLDYATETLIDFRLQHKIKERDILYKYVTDSHHDIIRQYLRVSTDGENKNLLKIHSEDIHGEDIHDRGYFLYYFYFLLLPRKSEFNCGKFFNQDYKWIMDTMNDNLITDLRQIKSIMHQTITDEEKNILLNEFFKEKKSSNVTNYESFQNPQLVIEKLNKILGNIRKILSKGPAALIQNDIIMCTIYDFLGKYLDLIIDEIISEETGICIFNSSIESDLYDDDRSYVFNNTINKLTVIIIGEEWNIYYINYKIEILTRTRSGVNLINFDENNYKYIIKIVPKKYEQILESGLDGGFTQAGLLQCKVVEYMDQLKSVLPPDLQEILKKKDIKERNEKKIAGGEKITDAEEIRTFDLVSELTEYARTDKNILTSKYYFIGDYVNQMFNSFTKYTEFKKTRHEPLDILATRCNHLEQKYIKYKNKYLQKK